MNPSLLVVNPARNPTPQEQAELNKLYDASGIFARFSLMMAPVIILVASTTLGGAHKAIVVIVVAFSLIMIAMWAMPIYREIVKPRRFAKRLIAEGRAFMLPPEVREHYEEIRGRIMELPAEYHSPLFNHLFAQIKEGNLSFTGWDGRLKLVKKHCDAS